MKACFSSVIEPIDIEIEILLLLSCFWRFRCSYPANDVVGEQLPALHQDHLDQLAMLEVKFVSLLQLDSPMFTHLLSSLYLPL
jgi:hypothetical protein